MDFVIALVIGYLAGSIPTAYIIARFYKQIDIRTVGSGNVGGSNVGMHVGKLPYAATLLFDLIKGALVIAVLERYGFGAAPRIAAGVAAIAGHNWPVWLGFAGGRGIATTGGVLFMFGPLETVLAGIGIGIGALVFKQGAVATLVVFALWPLVAALRGGRPEVIVLGLCVCLLIIVRRLQGSRGIHRNVAGERVHWNRFWFDRDIREEKAWVEQRGSKQ
ncbi:MAG: glycerol-3-phosphate acyltransferase [Chloroflexi bacterium]|nr:glycerol-3-phosphate acyltransferase [Chloroflexota bacterium]